MKDDKRGKSSEAAGTSMPSRLLGTLREALAAASRDSTGEITVGERTELLHLDGPDTARPVMPAPAAVAPPKPAIPELPVAQSAAEAVRQAKAPPREHIETAEPTTRVARGKPPPLPHSTAGDDDPKTQVVRGKPKIARAGFEHDPVVGWLVVIGGPGLGEYRPIHEGNNAIGRGGSQRIPLDFGDTSISSEEQAYIRYDSVDRSFLLVPNLAKTNVVAVNNKRPTGAVKLDRMDVISMGRTQLAFVPFCGEEFDWSELADLKE
jgi:hypothetical protein